MSDVDDLVEKAQKQLDEHKKWLAGQIYVLPSVVAMDAAKQLLVAQADQIRLRVAKANGKLVSVVYEYPDELYAFLRSDATPQHLRDALAGGHVVDPNQPTFSAKRVAE
jgi:hypothetical protein